MEEVVLALPFPTLPGGILFGGPPSRPRAKDLQGTLVLFGVDLAAGEALLKISSAESLGSSERSSPRPLGEQRERPHQSDQEVGDEELGAESTR